MGTLEGASVGYRAFAATTNPPEIMARAELTLDTCLAQGTVAIRSHTNIESEGGLRGIEAMIDLRERCRQRMTLQIVAHLTSDAPRKLDAAQQWLKEAIALGVDAIGGVPQNADHSFTFIDLLFDQAERSGLPLDMHIDEQLDPERISFDAIIERTRAHGMQGRVVAGHCCALSAIEQDEAKRIIEGFAEAEIGVVTLPAPQERSRTAAMPRTGWSWGTASWRRRIEKLSLSVIEPPHHRAPCARIFWYRSSHES
jgi:cytosine/creatinine deaminase